MLALAAAAGDPTCRGHLTTYVWHGCTEPTSPTPMAWPSCVVPATTWSASAWPTLIVSCWPTALSSVTSAPSPFATTERTSKAGDGRFEVDERIEYKVAAAPWNLLLALPVRRALRRRRPPGVQPWWAPPRTPRCPSGRLLAILATLAVVSAYLGTTLSQTLTFVAEDFGADKTAQATVLSLARIGVLVSLVATGLADRNGRRLVRRLLVVGCAVMAGAAAVPSLAAFGVIQTAARGLTIATDIIILVLAAETMPVRCRAWAASILTLVGGLGSGMVVWLLPLADLGTGAWRLIYLPSLAVHPRRHLGGTPASRKRRYLAVAHSDEREHQRIAAERRLHRPVVIRRLALLGIAAFLLLAFSGTGLPVPERVPSRRTGLLRSADHAVHAAHLHARWAGGLHRRPPHRHHRTQTRRRTRYRTRGSAASRSATQLGVGPCGGGLWSATITGGMAVPAIRVYGPELFPTHLRSRANGITTLCAVCGSATGIQIAGRLAEDRNFGSLTWPIVLLVAAPLLVAVLVLTVYPETGGRTLEELNPGDVGPEPLARRRIRQCTATPPVALARWAGNDDAGRSS